MPDIVDWGDINKNDGSKKKGTIRNLKLTSVDGKPKEYVLRFVGQPLEFYRYFANGKYAIVADQHENPVKKATGLDAQKRFAINAILRATVYNDERTDDGQVYMLDLPVMALKPVSAWAKVRKTDPGGKTGPDWSITVTGIKADTRYDVVALESTPFTDEEKEYLRANAYDLHKFFKPVPDDEVLDRLGLKGKSAASGGAAAPKEDEPAAAAKGVDLPF